ncbi:cytochrome c oxidase assembly protein ctaG-like [Macrobrachium nipponense]|uniref:cytochrome c oxidase assembly protein ctaG-like n=1 Tax=Macrobrachium nipponense TaxID=159736 RepID=UPI0030C8BDF8
MAFCKRFRGTGLLCFLSKPSLYPTRICLDLGYAVSVPKSFQAPRYFCSSITSSCGRQTIKKLFPCCKTNHQVTALKLSTTPRPRGMSPQSKSQKEVPSGKARGTKSTLYYIAALGVATLGLSYAAVPLYRIFCQAYSYGGTIQQGHDAEKVETMHKVDNRVITVRFNADTAASMTWNFKPQQSEIKVLPGETALAFYTARNPTDRPVIGVSTYNVIPFDAGQYFNKIQCFCFEEQLLNPHEEVHMPVFFYIDPEFVDDPKMENVDRLTLSYTFFEAREGVPIPIPNFAKY